MCLALAMSYVLVKMNLTLVMSYVPIKTHLASAIAYIFFLKALGPNYGLYFCQNTPNPLCFHCNLNLVYVLFGIHLALTMVNVCIETHLAYYVPIKTMVITYILVKKCLAHNNILNVCSKT